jgi:REase_MTES_1575
VLHQYPACGFNIDLIAQREINGSRVAIECDGERYHLDEHGLLKVEDIERQAILERAGWRVVRIPYRKWLADPGTGVARVIAAIDELAASGEDDDGYAEVSGDDAQTLDTLPVAPQVPNSPLVSPTDDSSKRVWVSCEQAALLEALKEGLSAEEDILLRVRDLLGSKRLTQKLRRTLHIALSDLARRRLVAIEDGEYFLLPAGREATFIIRAAEKEPRRRYRGRRHSS